MRKGYLSHRQTAKAHVSLRMRTVSPEPSLYAHTILYKGNQRELQTKSNTPDPFMRIWNISNRTTQDPFSHEMAQLY